MIESTILLQDVDPLILYGVNNAKLDILKKAFPLLKMVFRGDKIKVSGKEEDIENFEKKLNQILEHISVFQDLAPKDIETILLSDSATTITIPKNTSDIIVYGNSGQAIRARTPNQKVMVDMSQVNDILFAIGPAGTGKT